MASHSVVAFEYYARFGHFLCAEASASGLSYPVPSRTALLGLVGAVLGLEKDSPQELLTEAKFAVGGVKPTTHWHTAKFRKDPPDKLSSTVRSGAKGTSKYERATLPAQEWLFNPSYIVIAHLPEPYHSEFVRRLKTKEYYYTPCMGLSEMVAQLDFIAEGIAERIGEEEMVNSSTLVRTDCGTFDASRAVSQGRRLDVHLITLPRDVTVDRGFTHAEYIYETMGRSLPICTSHGWRVNIEGNIKEFMYL